ncbi:MAG TPA: GNAT family N-acetyltransferase [Armatimonadaceae bacterium]|jgi:ribosomal protein S18 acetylase RimI-like enzyme|nr:GNAT family N-acetyltransferase [Armatimonadaceae bacterium]
MENQDVVTVRNATHEDISLLAELSASTFRATFAQDNTPEDMEAYLAENFSEARLRQEVSDPLATFLIAEVSGKPLGYAKLHSGAPDASVTGTKPIELVRLYVLPESIGHGVGARLMQECIDTATSRGFETLWLGVWEHNPRAIRFYQKWGFAAVGSHVFRLGNDAQTDLIMQKSLTDPARLKHATPRSAAR